MKNVRSTNNKFRFVKSFRYEAYLLLIRGSRTDDIDLQGVDDSLQPPLEAEDGSIGVVRVIDLSQGAKKYEILDI